MNLPELNNVMKQFFTENERMEMTQEMMGEAMDMAMENPGEAEESEEVVNQVLSEIGIDIAGQIGNAGVRNL